MATAVANPPRITDYEDLRLRKFLVYSLSLHAGLAVLLAGAAYFHLGEGNQWTGAGAGGDSVEVKLVTSAGIPMPKPNLPTESQVVDPTQTLHNIEPPKLEQPPPDAAKLPKFEKEKPLPPSHKSKVFEPKKPPPDNAAPGRGGQPDLPTGVGDANGAASRGLAVQSQGGGDFASRYGWYIEAVRRRISGNWLQNTIDSSVLAARTAHSVVNFTIMKDGTVKDIRIQQTSGNLSMDNSGVRAVMSSNPMPPLPNDYSGSYVVVTFDFDLSMKR